MREDEKPLAQTLGQQELAIKLESIFTPYTRRQRDAAFQRIAGSDKSAAENRQIKCVHYTTAEAALKIISTKRLWMRNATCMSDYREVQHGFGLLKEFLSYPQKKQLLIDAVDTCAPRVTDEAIRLFDQWWSNTQLGTYIASMSEHDPAEDKHGRLSMWRAFGGNAARVAIVFTVPWTSTGTQALSLTFSPVAYVTVDQKHAELQEMITNIHGNREFLHSLDRQVVVSYLFQALIAAVTCSKHEGFREEREWRAIYSPQRLPSPLMESSTEVIGGVPQVVYKLPLDAARSPALADLDLAQRFERLIIGPSQYPYAMFEAFVRALETAGVPEPGNRVVVSGIPLRA